jgi:hypothetical protein
MNDGYIVANGRIVMIGDGMDKRTRGLSEFYVMTEVTKKKMPVRETGSDEMSNHVPCKLSSLPYSKSVAGI